MCFIFFIPFVLNNDFVLLINLKYCVLNVILSIYFIVFRRLHLKKNPHSLRHYICANVADPVNYSIYYLLFVFINALCLRFKFFFFKSSCPQI